MLQLAQLLPHLLYLEGGRCLPLLFAALHQQSRYLTLQLLHLSVLFCLPPEKFLIGAFLLLEH